MQMLIFFIIIIVIIATLTIIGNVVTKNNSVKKFLKSDTGIILQAIIYILMIIAFIIKLIN